MMYMSLIKICVAVLNNPKFYDLIRQEKKSTDGILRSYLDGLHAANHPLISKYPHTLRFTLYTDDFECVNAEGSKTIVHKICGMYFYIQNLPPEENARLRSIHVLGYAYREDLWSDENLEQGPDVMMRPFFQDLGALETGDGLDILVQGRPYILRGTLTNCTADTLGAHEMLGLTAPSF